VSGEDQPALFDLRAKPLPELSATARRTQRQAEAIAGGAHPLSLVGGWLALHPEADRNATRSDRSDLPFRCGTCRFREVAQYPKCHREGAPRSRGGGTDVRAWWPACTYYQNCND
jgi:hypothetical protein